MQWKIFCRNRYANMRNSLHILLAGLLVAVAAHAWADDPALTVAVFNFESNDEGSKDLGAKTALLINAHLSTDPRLVTVERAELEKALGEQELALSGTVSADTAAKVGHLTGAKVLVTGRVFRLDGELVMVAKVIGTETSRVYGEIAKGKASAPLTDLADILAGKIAAAIEQKADTLVAKVRSREDRISQLKRALGDEKLPAISVKIAEHHFGRPAVDPAAQTELAMIFQQCGFTVVDEKSDAKPDVEIIGEAFSELGLRKGNLVSCKARVEVKVRKRTDGRLLMVDRQTSVAVDIGEQIAAKNALQNATVELAMRLVPKVSK
jgi:hypothetical protein